MLILGISAYYHDAAACLLEDGALVAASQEERFTRQKHDARFPERAIRSCLEQAGRSLADVDYVGYYEKPHRKLERILSSFARAFPAGFSSFSEAMPEWLGSKLFLPDVLRRRLLSMMPRGARRRWDGRIVFGEHHRSHAASAYHPSPFRQAAILTMDGVGEWSCTSLAEGRPDERDVPRITVLREQNHPDSLGLLYSAITAHLGFKIGSGESKVMGLAPYGRPRHVSTMLDRLLDLKPDGSFRLDMKYFSFPHDHVMVTEALHALFDLPPRAPESPLGQPHFDLAASLQVVTDRIVLATARHLHALTGQRALCMAGGVALNCVSNAVVLREGPFDKVWIQPAAGDAGGALGIAYEIHHEMLGERRRPSTYGRDRLRGARSGPAFDDLQIQGALVARGLPFEVLAEEALVACVTEHLANGAVIGWFQGAMELGPRALGGRSILADPRSASARARINDKIKRREAFRPFAPSVPLEEASRWFDLEGASPYMLFAVPVRSEFCESIPAVTHIDGSSRLQTVERADDPLFHRLLTCFGRRTGVPILVNTSFNVRGEPIVCTPDDAIDCFLGTELDLLVMGHALLNRRHMPESAFSRREFPLD